MNKELIIQSLDAEIERLQQARAVLRRAEAEGSGIYLLKF